MTKGDLLIAFAYLMLALVLLLVIFTVTAKHYVAWELKNESKENKVDFENRLEKKGLYRFRFETTEGPVTLWAINGKNALKKLKKRGLTQIDNNDD